MNVSTNSQQQSHLVRFCNSNWALWQCVGFRSAGFSNQNVLKLSCSNSIEKGNLYLDSENALKKQQNELVCFLKKMTQDVTKNNRSEFRSLIKQAQKGKQFPDNQWSDLPIVKAYVKA